MDAIATRHEPVAAPEEPTGLTQHDVTPALLGPRPTAAEAALLGEVDLAFHPADVEWSDLHREIDAATDGVEDPLYDYDNPWSRSHRAA